MTTSTTPSTPSATPDPAQATGPARSTGPARPPGPVPATRVWPTIRATDARALIDFLVAAFGFIEVVAHPDGSGGIAHAELAWPEGGGLMLGSVRPPGAEDAWPVSPGTTGCYVVTSDLDTLFARASAAGARILGGPEDTDYGSRQFVAADPEGNMWSFGTYQGEPVSP